jgi:hypothetical protein
LDEMDLAASWQFVRGGASRARVLLSNGQTKIAAFLGRVERLNLVHLVEEARGKQIIRHLDR